MIGIGGSVDMLVGERRRAPVWVQRAGLEWVFRAAQEPRRLGARYAHDLRVFGPRFAAELRANRQRGREGGLRVEVGCTVTAVLVPGPADGAGDGADWSAAAEAIAGGSALTLSTDTARPPDHALAAVAGLVRTARWVGAPISWTGDAPARLGPHLGAIGVDPWLIALDPHT